LPQFDSSHLDGVFPQIKLTVTNNQYVEDTPLASWIRSCIERPP